MLFRSYGAHNHYAAATALPLSLHLSSHPHRRNLFNLSLPRSPRPPWRLSLTASTDQLWAVKESQERAEGGEGFEFSFEAGEAAARDVKHLEGARAEVKELEEVPEQWRRSKLAWLCKELPAHKPGTLVRILNAQKKWIVQEDALYVAHHCMRIRENETAFRVYKWMMQRPWYQFDFDFITRLADYMGKERKFSKCRELFDDIIKQGRVPSESTFHILIVAYLSAPVQGCLEEACGIYNKMIQLGGYKPRLSLHNSLFKALVSKPGGSCKHHLKQAEFVFHNLVTCGLEVHKDVYAGLIWLHSYQDTIDRERIIELREEMQKAGIEESSDVHVSILRAYSKEGDVEEVERNWVKLVESDGGIPSQALVYRMEVYAKVGEPMKSLDVLREMERIKGAANVVAYHTVIEIMAKAHKVETAETLMDEFVNSGLKPLMPSYIELMSMYLNLDLHDKLEATFMQCLQRCRSNRTICSIYLDSLVKVGSLDKASEIFNQMLNNGAIGINSKSCNTILRAYLDSGEFIEAEEIYDLMCEKKFDIDPLLMEKLDYALSLKKKVVKKPTILKLSKEQREILVGLLLGGLHIESDEERKNHVIHFEFSCNSTTHSVLRRHIYDEYHEWLHPACRTKDENEEVPYHFSTVAHSYFEFYADQFRPKGRPVIPKLIHRWLSPRVLAYCYMSGGHRTSSGDLLLKLKGANREDVERIVKTFKEKSLDCRVKKKGRVFWIGFFGSNSLLFWKLMEPYILDDLKDLLKADIQVLENDAVEDRNQHINFDSDSDSDGRVSDVCDNEI
ncbi:hypothetical protein Scep_017218 [Stephania cephalantha]|uniref:Homing endonuclease LAGLIDADG domain-containing protein n=1 Tax=Stephania cephalantha TaxID=152367 RepID=A0AAP0NVG0_9MAGN